MTRPLARTTSTVTATICGKPRTVTVTVKVDYDECPVDVDMADDEPEYLARFGPGGDLINTVVWVSATAGGLTGEDSLGGCHISNLTTDVDLIVDEHGMIDNAVEQLQREAARILTWLTVETDHD